MEYRFVIKYTTKNQQESLNVILESPQLSIEEARKIVADKLKTYGENNIENISVVKADESENINTDPSTSASE